MKLVSWNVNGIRAIAKKGFIEWLHAESPDILCLQETKCHPELDEGWVFCLLSMVRRAHHDKRPSFSEVP